MRTSRHVDTIAQQCRVDRANGRLEAVTNGPSASSIALSRAVKPANASKISASPSAKPLIPPATFSMVAPAFFPGINSEFNLMKCQPKMVVR
jgi:hypothetical protein